MKATLVLVFCNAITHAADPITPEFEAYNKEINAWIGRTEDQLYTTYGPPHSFKEHSGKKYASYHYQENAGSTSDIYTLTCGINFIIADETITDAKYTGNLGLVRAHVLAPPDLSEQEKNEIQALKNKARHENNVQWMQVVVGFAVATVAVVIITIISVSK